MLSSPAPPSPPDRLKWRLLSVLAALLPGFGAVLGARSVTGVFHAMAVTGVGSAGAVSAGLYESNRAVIFAGVVGTLFSAALAVLAASKPERASALPGPIFSGLIALVASVPALLLWNVESSVLHVVCNQMDGSATEAVETARHLATLVIATAVCGFLGPVLLLVIASISRLFPPRPQAAPPVRARILTWIGLAILTAGITVAFSVRSSALRKAATTGSCGDLAWVLPSEQSQEPADAGRYRNPELPRLSQVAPLRPGRDSGAAAGDLRRGLRRLVPSSWISSSPTSTPKPPVTSR